MNNNDIRLLYLPNEEGGGYQIEARLAFESILKNGELSDYQAFSFWDELEKLRDPLKVDAKLFEIAEACLPNIILWQHPAHYPLNPRILTDLKNLKSKPILVYDERDAYGKFYKPLPNGSKILAKYADIVFTVALGQNAELLYRAGAKKIYYSPQCSAVRFDKSWDPTKKRRYDVIMIGNLQRLGLPLLSMPGASKRRQIAEALWRLLGGRFAVFGEGWSHKPYAKGYLPCEKQEIILRDSLISVGWNYFDQMPYYFGDRLPMALLSGVIYVTNYHPGYEILFRNGVGIFYVKTVKEMIDTVKYLLGLPLKKLIEIGEAGRNYARKYFTSEVVFRDLIVRSMQEREEMIKV